MERIFLSASVPDPKRDPKYFETADVLAIREAVRALATLLLPRHLLVWGGHPAITPMIRVIAESLGASVQEHVLLYQSEFFRHMAPPDNDAFAHVVWVPPVEGNRDLSLEQMREAMLRSGPFRAGVFIGGMEGVEDELEMFQRLCPQARVLPVASTGGAALEIYRRAPGRYPRALLEEYAYATVFRRLLELPLAGEDATTR